MKRKAILLFALLSLYGIIASAQADFQKGLIILNSNDTVKGLIDLRSSKFNNQVCRFKESKKSPIQTYKPNDIKAYILDVGKYYVSKVIDIDGVIDTVFAENIIDGQLSMFFYKDKDFSYYFFEDESKKPIYVSNKKVFTYGNDGRKYIKDNITNRGSLVYYLSESQETAQKVNKITLNQDKLIPIIKEYNEVVCPDKKCTVYAKKIKPVFSMGPLLGYNKNTVYIIRNGYILNEPAISNSMQYGVSGEYTVPALSKGLFVSFYSAYCKNKLQYGSKTSPSIIEYNNLNFNASVYYCYQHYRLQPLAGIGISVATTLGSSKQYYYNSPQNFAPTKRTMYAPTISAGLKFKINKKIYLKSYLETDFLQTDIRYDKYFQTVSSNINAFFGVFVNL